jgi:transposase-like protein
LNYYITTRKIWKCSKRECRKQFSLTRGTIFEDTNIPLVIWFKAIYYFTVEKRGLASTQLAKHLEVEQRTAWFILHRLRETVSDENEIELEGIVEADESQVGPEVSRDTRLGALKKAHDERMEEKFGMSESKARRVRGFPAKNGRKKGSTKEVLAQKKKEREAMGERTQFERDIMLLGMTERNGRVILKKLGRGNKSKNSETIYPLLKKHINSNSILMTDEWNLYDETNKIFKDHQTVNHDDKEYARGEAHINSIENVWNHFQRTLDGTFFHMTYQHMDRYLHEFCYRWNRRNAGERALFNDFFPTVEGKRLKYQELISLPKYPYLPAA